MADGHRAPGLLTVAELRAEVDAGRVDTVLLAMTDMQGRLQGKRLAASHFLDEVLEHNAEGCNYLLAVDVDMNTVGGYAMSSWDLGYGDFVFRPDLSTLRRIPWHEGTALVLCDLEWEDGRPVVASPRTVLRRQLERLTDRGWQALAGTELEFIVFRDSFEDAWRKGYRELRHANDYNVDYSMLGTARIEPLLRRIRNSMAGAGLRVESAKGECNYGQHEIAFRYADALATADGHAIYKNGAKEIAAQEGYSLTFMSKFNEREGNSCHIHFSLRGADDGALVMAGDRHHGYSELLEQFLAGQLACLRELTLFLAPNVNSYKRYAAGSFAPTAVAWGHDNRTCALRVVGHGHGLRLENRVPGGDVNPYLALAAIVAAGLHGVDKGLTLEDEYAGNAYLSDKPKVPRTLREARELFAASEVAHQAFGSDVVEHYSNMAAVELDAFDAAVTDWERFRGFERL
ncbi:MAG TPA: glutamine synthetase family protein [Actinomycetes bacterium]|jgi:glutamine synthetase|nr:glutamine synthetase family protein [Actinomycetes bacterium]